MGIRIMTDGKPVKVWRSDRLGFPTYSISISTKEGDHYINEYQEIKFRKGVEVENGAMIHIQRAFPTIISWVNNTGQHTKKVWQILNFSYAKDDIRVNDQTELPIDWEEIP